jgi:hypothetical protein
MHKLITLCSVNLQIINLPQSCSAYFGVLLFEYVARTALVCCDPVMF